MRLADRVVRNDIENQVAGAVVADLVRFAGLEEEGGAAPAGTRRISTSNGRRNIILVDFGSRPSASEICLPNPRNFPLGVRIAIGSAARACNSRHMLCRSSSHVRLLNRSKAASADTLKAGEGGDIMHWALVIRLVLAALLLRRLTVDGVAVRRGALPLTRLAIPALLLIAAILIANGVLPRPTAVAALFVLDIAFLTLCASLAWSFARRADRAQSRSAHLEHVLEKFFPEWFARFAVTDLLILSHASAGIRAFIDPGPPGMRTYIQGSKMGMGAVIMAAAIVPDAVFLALVIPQKMWWLAAALDVLDVWACLWFFGIYGTMVRRPHDISPHKIVLRNGIWETLEINPADIASASVAGVVKRRRLPCAPGERVAFLSFGGVPLVDVKLKQPALARRRLGAPRAVDRVFVASDAPGLLCAEFAALSAPEMPPAATSVTAGM